MRSVSCLCLAGVMLFFFKPFFAWAQSSPYPWLEKQGFLEHETQERLFQKKRESGLSLHLQKTKQDQARREQLRLEFLKTQKAQPRRPKEFSPAYQVYEMEKKQHEKKRAEGLKAHLQRERKIPKKSLAFELKENGLDLDLLHEQRVDMSRRSLYGAKKQSQYGSGFSRGAPPNSSYGQGDNGSPYGGESRPRFGSGGEGIPDPGYDFSYPPPPDFPPPPTGGAGDFGEDLPPPPPEFENGGEPEVFE